MPPVEPPAAAWSLANLWAGLQDVRTWLPLAGRALVLELAAPIGTWVSIIAVWMGAAVAHNARGWRSIILPFLGVIFALLVPVLALMMVSGAVLSLESLLKQLGLIL